METELAGGNRAPRLARRADGQSRNSLRATKAAKRHLGTPARRASAPRTPSILSPTLATRSSSSSRATSVTGPSRTRSPTSTVCSYWRAKCSPSVRFASRARIGSGIERRDIAEPHLRRKAELAEQFALGLARLVRRREQPVEPVDAAGRREQVDIIARRECAGRIRHQDFAAAHDHRELGPARQSAWPRIAACGATG